jgi:uncharacterized protein
MLAVSGRISALVDSARRSPDEATEEMTPEELMAAVQAATAEAFGSEAVSGEAVVLDDDAKRSLAALPSTSAATHLAFFVAVASGGVLSAALFGRAHASLEESGLRAFASAVHVPPTVLLFLGGLLVGIGTRMAGGCTSGHGLCGVSRFQSGSLVATAIFFGLGIVVASAIGALS